MSLPGDRCSLQVKSALTNIPTSHDVDFLTRNSSRRWIGVFPTHFLDLGKALLWSLEQILEHAFTSERRRAWHDVYGVLSPKMVKAL